MNIRHVPKQEESLMPQTQAAEASEGERQLNICNQKKNYARMLDAIVWLEGGTDEVLESVLAAKHRKACPPEVRAKILQTLENAGYIRQVEGHIWTVTSEGFKEYEKAKFQVPHFFARSSSPGGKMHA